MPKRLIATSLILIVIGMLPSIFALLHLSLPSPAPLLNLLLPPHLAQFLVDAVSFKGIAVIGFALGALAAVLMARGYWEQRNTDGPITTTNVLLEEAKAIHGRAADQNLTDDIARFFRREPQEDGEPEREQAAGRDEVSNVSPSVYRWLHGLDPRGRTALCFSGGGIRSASFALGVLQALARHPRAREGQAVSANPKDSLLAQFNYLSTVSGGGYIGGWFSTWVQRVGFASVWRDLARAGGREQDPGEQAAPLKWLRVHSNFLTPTLGLSGDTLAGVAIFLRNLLLNWLVLLPALCAVLIVMKLLALEIFRLWVAPWELRSVVTALLIWFVALVAALSFTLRNRPSRTYGEKKQATHTALLLRALLPSVISAVAFTLFLALNVVNLNSFVAELATKEFLLSPVVKPLLLGLFAALKDPSLSVFVTAGVIGSLIYALAYSISWIWSWRKACSRAWRRARAYFADGDPVEPGEATAGNFWRWTLSGAVYGALVMAISYVFLKNGEAIEKMIFLDYLRNYTGEVNAPRHLLALIYLGVPMMLGSQLAAEMIFVGLTSEEVNSEEDREWLGRAAGLCLLAALGWFVVMHLAFISSDIAIRAGKILHQHPGTSLVFVGALYAVAAVAAAIGRSGRTPAQQAADMGVAAKSISATLTTVATVLLVVLVVGVSALVDYLVLGDSIAEHAGFKPYLDATGGCNPACDAARVAAITAARFNFLLALAVVLFVGLISSTSININRFSMHALYRNRLIRAFLGASNLKRRADPFTDFARDDNPPMHALWPSQHTWTGEPASDRAGERSWCPFHIVNIALNVTSSEKHLEWQERKACSFTVSPLHSGSAITGFRPSEDYGGGISLGTAVAVSGAAASPNMGYLSSAPLAFLMALFNVRLGWWLGNPGRSGEVTHAYDGPKNALVPFIAEMLGMTSDANKYVYLSDGGHFENLALYEMVRRRCRFVVLSDAGCDPEFAFEDLGNAVRKIELDLGVPIHFHGLSKLKSRHSPDRVDRLMGRLGPPSPGEGTDPPYHAIGIIDYRAADGAGVENGMILYIKPGYHGTESSAAVRSYAIANPAFPHESTGDQFFSESQMESYRALGFEIMDDLLEEAYQRLQGKSDLKLQDLLAALQARSNPQPASAGQAHA